MFVVTVSFVLKPDIRDSFLPLMLENARQSSRLNLIMWGVMLAAAVALIHAFGW